MGRFGQCEVGEVGRFGQKVGKVGRLVQHEKAEETPGSW